MASPQASQKYFAQDNIQMWDHDPGTTAATVITPDTPTNARWVDMRDYSQFGLLVMSSTLTGAGMTLVEIVANTASDGSGTTVVITTSGAVVADAVGDYVVLECSQEQLAQEGSDNSVALRYVAGRVTVANNADECVATYI
ncbi:unnamed protein product, partial [marine sediment metagenome]